MGPQSPGIRSYERRARAATWLITLCLCAPAARAADPPLPVAGRELVRASLVSDAAAIAPGTRFRLGVHLHMADGWHVNWINPGDAGLAPSIKWTLPAGFKAGIVQWPLPSRFDTGPLTIFGYEKDVLLMVDVQAPTDLSPGRVDLAADVSWLACAEECVPGSATVRLSLPVEPSPRADSAQQAFFDTTNARLPRRAITWNVDARMEPSSAIVLQLQDGSGGDAHLGGVFFFPYDPGLIENAAPQPLATHAGPGGQPVYELRITRARIPAGAATNAHGVLVAESGLAPGAGPAAIEIDVPISPR